MLKNFSNVKMFSWFACNDFAFIVCTVEGAVENREEFDITLINACKAVSYRLWNSLRKFALCTNYGR